MSDLSSTSTARKFAPNRYRRQSLMFLDYDNGGYINTYSVLDGEKDTGIVVSDSGHSNTPDSNKRVITFNGEPYPLLRDAIIAYEDSLTNAVEERPLSIPAAPSET